MELTKEEDDMHVHTEKTVYLIQIAYLDIQLERNQSKCEELEQQNRELSCQFAALEKDKKSSSEQLKRSVFARELKVDDLAERLENQLQADETERKELEQQQSREKTELQERVQQLSTENSKQALQYSEQQDQVIKLIQQMDEMKQHADLETMKQQLVDQMNEHRASVRSLEEEAALEWKRSLTDMQNTVDKCVKTKTSNILRAERAQHGERLGQLGFLQNEAEILVKEQDVLEERETELCVERDELKTQLLHVTQDNFTYKKELEQWRVEWQQLQVEREDWGITNEHMMAQEHDLRQRLASVTQNLQQKSAEATELQTELQTERDRKRQLERVMLEAVFILRHILTDPENASETQWKMQRLLEVLESTAPQGKDPPTTTSQPKPARKLCSRKSSRAIDPSDVFNPDDH